MGLVYLSSCSSEDVDYNNPDPEIFVKEIKAGRYDTKSPYGFVEVPVFQKKDIPELITHVKDMSKIPFFPTNTVSSYGPNANYRLGECVLWTIESIRVGKFASFGCKLVRKDTNEHMQYAFLSDKEVECVADLYIKWWNKVINQQGYNLKDVFLDNPLAGTNYRWN